MFQTVLKGYFTLDMLSYLDKLSTISQLTPPEPGSQNQTEPTAA